MKAASLLVERLDAAGLTLAAAESCTAGLVADLIACVPGSSRVFWGSFVTYMTDAKVCMLGIDRGLIEKFGAVSRETVQAMASGALEKSGADISAAVTGLAGPAGDGGGSPVGTVWIATAYRNKEIRCQRYHFTGARNEVRLAAALEVLEQVLARVPGT
jgi:PncC family amidohydrolase